MVDQRERLLGAADVLDHHRRRLVVERRARRHEPGEHAHDDPVEHLRRATTDRSPARRRSAGPGRAERAPPSDGRCPDRRRRGPTSTATIGGDGVGQRRQQRQVERGGDIEHARCAAGALDEPVGRRLARRWCPSRRPRRSRTDHSGRHTSRQVSRNVPLEPRPSSSEPHGTPSAVSWCSRCERRSPFGVRRSSSITCGSAAGLSRAARWRRARSRARGTCGAPSGTAPIADPDDEPALDQREPAHHGVGGVEHLGQPGPRPAAHHRQRVGDTCRRDQMVGRRLQVGLAQHAGGVDEEPGDALGTGMAEDVVVPAGAAHARAVAGGDGEPGVGPRHPAHVDLRLRQAAQQGAASAGRPRCVRRRRAPARATPRTPRRSGRGRRGPRRGSRPACAPRAALRESDGVRAGAHDGHRLGDRLERRQTLAAMLDHVVPPTLGVGLAGRRRQSADRIGRLAVGEHAVVGAARRRARSPAGGRSRSTGTPWALAHRIACHSGLNEASGANTARRGSSTT